MKIQDKRYVLDFSGGHLEIPVNDSLNFSTTLTLAAWIKPASGSGLQATILSKGYKAYEPQVQNGKLVFERGPEYASASAIPLNQWSYITVTFDAERLSDNLCFYINGKLDKSYDLTTPLATSADPLWIGARSKNGLPYAGQMAGVALWSRAHDSWQVQQNYNDINETAEDLVAYWPMEDGAGTQTNDLGHLGLTAAFSGSVQWQALTEQITNTVTQRQRLRNTSVSRMNQLLEQGDDAHLEDHAPLPSSGRNGEATKLLNRVRAHTTLLVAERKQQANAEVKAAQKARDVRLTEAHAEAAKKINSARFDALWFVYKGRIHSVNRQGDLSEFHVGNVETVSKSIPANTPWVGTGVTVAAGETVKIRYTGGRWSVSPAASNLTAQGATRFIAKPGYALPGRPEGALVGRIGQGAPFYVGNGYEVPVGQTGELQLAANDDVSGKYGRGYADNSGALTVEIDLVKQAVSVDAADLCVDQAKDLLVWAQSTVPFTLHAAQLDGSGHRTLVASSKQPVSSVTLDELNQWVYYIEGTGVIRRVKYDGTADPQFSLDISGPAKEQFWQLEIDQQGKKLYWTNDYSIWSANTDGSQAALVVGNHDAPFPIDIAIDTEDNKLYWVDKELEVVRRSDLDGNNPEDIHAARNPARGLMLDRVSPDMRDQLKQEVYWAVREETITAQTPGIVGVWPLESGAGERLLNQAYPFNETVLGLLKERDDLPGNLSAPHYALTFNGNDFARVPNEYIDGLKGKSFTVEMWVKPQTLVAQGDVGLLAGTNFATNKCLHLIIRNGKPYMGFYNNDLAGNTQIKTGEWTHLAFRFDAGKGEQTIFVNGILDNSSTGHAPLDNDPGTLTLLGAYGGNYLNGLLADVRISRQPLSQDAIQATMEEHKPGDLMGNIVSAPAWNHTISPPVIYPRASVLEFDGLSTYVAMGQTSDLALFKHSFTVECWVKPAVSASGDLSILGTDTRAASQGLHLVVRNNKPYFGFFADDLAGATTLAAGEWVHLAWRFDANTLEQTLFVNGNEDGHRIAKAVFQGEGTVYLGRWASGRIFNGCLSELRIWNTARTQEQISTNFRHYRESYAMRGPVDGSSAPEHLFDIPAEGGMNLVSQLEKEYELRLLAYRKRKQNQEIATQQIAAAHEDKAAKITAKTKELTTTQTETTAAVDAKKSEHTQDRDNNRTRLSQAQSDKSTKINNAKSAAQQRKVTAQGQAADIKSQANSQAAQMKSSAQAERDRARAARDKNRR